MAQDTSSTKTAKALDDYVLLGRSGLRVSPLCNTTAMQEDTRLNPNLGGNHRKSLVENLNESLKRLNMSYVDILYVHVYEFRTPIEEIMRSLDDAVRSGKVLYVAASNFPSWALARANTFAELRGWSSFIGLQTRYSLLDRSLEFDLQPACAELDVGIILWGAVAEGFLTGKHTRESAANLESEHRSHKIADHSKVAMNWVQQKPGITSPLIGARTVTQLEENLKSLEFKLTPEQVKRLDEASKPAEIPFPNSFVSNYDRFIGKNIEVPRKFEAISTSCNFGRINL
ncbi:Aldo/keto reductase [Rhizophagus irregularis]|uniref:Aldo/keto reductase n=1 Tax=Rhizophagus irregularis TaxID=588596 RepID=A0A2I1H928_9GLOM|nr:Aldo/keto reductase [Rhizophagus irregularis]